jgi:hypothetical protein
VTSRKLRGVTSKPWTWPADRQLLGRGLAAGHNRRGTGQAAAAVEIFQRIGAAEFSDLSAELKAITDERSTTQ